MKKILSVILSAVMIISCFSLLGMAAYADSATASDATAIEATKTEAYKLGDVNEDGKISVVDAKWILQSIAGIRELSDAQKAAADINKDGEIKVVDAKIVLKVVAGLDTLIQVGSENIDDNGWVEI